MRSRLIFCVVAFLLTIAGQILAQNPRVYITDSQSWEMSGSGSPYGGGASGGARGQTAELIKTFTEKCPNTTINNNRDKADYSVVFDHEGGKSWYRKDNKIAVFNKDGDAILSKSTRSLGGSVEESCKAILADWESKGKARAAEAAKTPAPAAAVVNAAEKEREAPPSKAKVTVASQPAGADIEVDGAFVGSTPSTVELAAGDHTITVKKDGFQSWEKKIKTTGGEVNLVAELKKTE